MITQNTNLDWQPNILLPDFPVKQKNKEFPFQYSFYVLIYWILGDLLI